MKRLFGSLVFLFAGVLALASCGGSSTTTTTTTTITTTTSGSGAATVYPNAVLLVSGASLNVGATNQVIIDTRSAALYAAGHITNAINMPLAALDTASATTPNDTTELKSPSAAAAVLGAAGVSSTNTIIVYGTDVDAGAGRVFWDLEYLGAKDVHILDGGYTKWTADGRTVVTTATTLPATTFTPNVDAVKLATKADVVAHYADTTNYVIIDSRNYTDNPPTATSTNPLYGNYVTAHIPNAVSILIGNFLNADKTVKSYADIKALLDSKGVTAGKIVITHCYVGQRSAQEYFMLRLMGFPVSNYDGSWFEWASNPSLPTSQAMLLGGAALNVNATNQVIIDTRSAALYAAGHITNAINIPPSTLDTISANVPTDTSDLKGPGAIATILGTAGVSHTANIIVYGADTDSNAGRLFWALDYLGARNVSILDGGYAKWKADNRTLVTSPTTLSPATFTPNVYAAALATKADVLAHYADTANYAVVDSRNYSDPSTNNYVTAHIPNAVSVLTSHYLDPVTLTALPPTFGSGTPGSGCTLNITAVNGTGALTGVAVNAPGSGYAVGSLLMVEGGDHNAMVKVDSVNGTGGVLAVTIVKAGPASNAASAAGGTPYAAGTGVATRDYSSLANVLSANGVTAGKTVITHCYVGYRSAQAYFMLKYMGFKVSNYDGSWTEWFADPTPLPTKAGALP